MLTIDEQVANGVAWLDETQPDWRERVHAYLLTMDNACLCICGQVFAEVCDQDGSGYQYAMMIAVGGDDGSLWSMEHGFSPDWSRYQRGVYREAFVQGWGDLERAWLDELARPAPVRERVTA